MLTTPAQLNQRLASLAARRASNEKVQSKLGDSRQRQIDRDKAKLTERQQARSQALGQAQSGRATGRPGTGITPARDYFPDTGGGSNIGLMIGGFF
ncbi:MAG: hypothetical protein HYX69_14525 [Planctomycetia bacterium]|nr:hypothetical protein [Planctomycetia bacterium]